MVISASSSCLGQPREGVQSPSLSRFKTWVDAALSSLVWVTCLSRGLRQGDLQRCLSKSHSLQYYKSWTFWTFCILSISEGHSYCLSMQMEWCIDRSPFLDRPPASASSEGCCGITPLTQLPRTPEGFEPQGLSSKMKDWWETSTWDRIEMRI